jgi:protein disulfide-isomerase
MVSAMLIASGCNKSSLKDLAPLRPNKPSDEIQFGNSSGSSSGSSSGDSEADSLTLTVWHDSMDAAMEASAETGKPILADFTGSDWCGWCTKLKNDVFETREFKQWARENVILLELDYPKRLSQPAAIKQQNAELKSRYSINGYPTVLLLSSDGSPIGKRLGYRDNPTDWISSAEFELQKVRTADRRNQD